MRIKLFFLFCLFLIDFHSLSCAVPVIKKDSIWFDGGRSFSFKEKDYYKNSKMLKDFPYAIHREAKLVENSERIVFIESFLFVDFHENKVTIFDFSGNQIAPPVCTRGEVVVVPKKGRLLLVEYHNYFESNEENLVFVIDVVSGKVLRKIKHSYSNMRISDDEAIFSFAYFIRDKGAVPKWEYGVYNFDGEEIKRERISFPQDISVQYLGENYEILKKNSDFFRNI